MRISDWSSDVCSSDLRMWATPAARLWVPLLYRAARLCQRMLPTLAQRLNAAAMRRLHTHQALSDIDLTLLPGESLGIIGLNAIGRESGRARVCQYVSISVVAVTLKKKQVTPTSNQ